MQERAEIQINVWLTPSETKEIIDHLERMAAMGTMDVVHQRMAQFLKRPLTACLIDRYLSQKQLT